MLQAITGGAANRGEFLPPPTTNGREAVDRLLAENWIQPTRDTTDTSTLSDSPDDLKSAFSKLFPDGVVLDLQTREGTREMRNLKQSVLAGILPAAVKSLEEGALVVPVSERWLSAVFHEGKLRLFFILPPEYDREQFRSWLRTVKAWHAGSSRTEGVSHVRTG